MKRSKKDCGSGNSECRAPKWLACFKNHDDVELVFIFLLKHFDRDLCQGKKQDPDRIHAVPNL